MQEIRLQYDSEVHQKQKENGQAGSMLFDVRTEELEISGISLLDYLIRSRVQINSILIDHPSVKVIEDTTVSKKEGDKKQNISEILNSIKIGGFNLKDAEISYHNYEKKAIVVHKIPKLNITINDFLADSFDKKSIKEMISVDDLFISLKNQSYTTSNKAYKLNFDLFSYSLSEQELRLESFSAIGNHKKMKGPMITPEVQVPLLKMEGLEIIKALKSKKLHLKELLIDSTYVELYELPDLDVTVADVYRGLAKYFEVTEIDDLKINHSRVSMYSRENKNVLVQKIEHVDILIEEVSFDSLSVFDPKNNLPLQQLTLNINDYLFSPEKNPHTIRLASLDMNTKENSLNLGELDVSANIKKNKELGYNSGKASAQLIDLRVPEIKMDGLDLIRAFQTSNMEIDKITILNSTSSITQAFESKSSGSDFSAKDTYQSISKFIKEINIQEFLISNADVSQYPTDSKAQKLHHLENARISLKGIHLDSALAYKDKPNAPINEILVQLDNYQYSTLNNTKSLALSPFQYSSRGKSLNVNNIFFKSRSAKESKETDSIEINVSTFSISDFDLVNAYRKGELNIKEVLLKSPEINVSRGLKLEKSIAETEKKETTSAATQKEIFKWINPITIESIKLVDGTADYKERLDDITNFQNLQGFLIEINKLKLTPENINNTKNILPVENVLLKAKNYTFHSPDSMYTVKLDSLFYSSKKKNLTANLFELIPDYDLQNQTIKQNIENAHANLFKITANQFTVEKFDLINAFNTGKYTFGEVLLESPELSILQNKKVLNYQQKTKSDAQKSKSIIEKENNNKEKINKDIQNQIDKYVGIFAIDRIRITDANFLFEVLKEDTIRESQKLENLSLLIENLQLADLEARDFTDIFSVDDIHLLLENYNFITPNSLYELRVDKLKASVTEKYIHVDSINYKPLFLIEEYADKLDYAQDRFDVKVGKVEVEGFNFDELFNYQKFIIESILIDGVDGSIYRDSRVKSNPDRQPVTVQKFVKDLPVPIKLDTLALKNGKIIYSEISKDGSEPGITSFTDTDFKIINITNDSLVYSKNDSLIVNGVTSFLGESKLEIAFNFDMNHPDDLYTYEGYLEEMNFEKLNPLFTNILFVKMKSGEMKKLEFSVKATKDHAEGMMYFPYQNLRFKLLNKDDIGNPGFLLNVVNWSLNHLIIKSNNPGKLFNVYRDGKIDIKRNYQKSVFNHMGNALLMGLISSTTPKPIEFIIGTIGIP